MIETTITNHKYDKGEVLEDYLPTLLPISGQGMKKKKVGRML